ncbi:EamA family transporter RarD [Pendulispora brunnea]|uniref:EamA family transporter RarD n=1 Tax=Pendulispora brunnea TaxID=2905690 RepID=A0ABZ2JU22_9BACT
MSEQRKGVFFGIAAYMSWGLFPLFWPLLKPAAAFEILAHRIVWSLVVMVILMARLRSLNWLRAIGGRRIRMLALAAGLVSANWATYIWAVNHGHVVETALGYFINPLVSVLLGVFFLGERVRRAQWIALSIAAIAVVILTIDYGRLPWIALTLALTFGLYGFVKKKAAVGALESLTVETGLLFLPALGYLLYVDGTGHGTFGHVSTSKDLLLASCGVLTAVPLLWFAAAANRVPLTTVGLLQYIAPILQFLCGVVVMHEDMPASRWAGFTLVWLGLAVFALESILHRRRQMQQLSGAAPAIPPGSRPA